MCRSLRAAASGAFAVATCLIACAAFGDDDPIMGTGQERELSVGGLTRTYRAVHPPGVPPQPALVVVLHGGFGTGQGAQDAYGWDAVAQSSRVVIAYPDGIGRSWNGGRCCGAAQSRNIDDVAFLTEVIRDLERRDGVDPRRIYVTGMSNGAIMAYRLACEGPIPLAAIGPVAGDLEVPCTSPVVPVSVMAIHGTADQNVPLGGGVGVKSFVKTEHTSVAASLARWRAIDRCQERPATSRRGPVVRETTDCASTGTAVDLITIDGAGHQWPGAKPPSPQAARLLGLDPPSEWLDATDALWSFFQPHVASSVGPNGAR
jgi:polyhydroxybutyrate depolymerase